MAEAGEGDRRHGQAGDQPPEGGAPAAGQTAPRPTARQRGSAYRPTPTAAPAVYEAAAASGPPSSNHSIEDAGRPRRARGRTSDPSSVASQPDRPAPARFSSPGRRVPVARGPAPSARRLPPAGGRRPRRGGARLGGRPGGLRRHASKLTGATPAQLAHRHRKVGCPRPPSPPGRRSGRRRVRSLMNLERLERAWRFRVSKSSMPSSTASARRPAHRVLGLLQQRLGLGGVDPAPGHDLRAR